MYQLAYVECPRPTRDCGVPMPEAPHFRVEPFACPRDALDRAREIIGAPTVSSVELYADTGEIVFDSVTLAVELGWPLPSGDPVRWYSDPAG